MEILDAPDGKRMKAVSKKLKAVFPGVTLNCASAEKTVVLDCGPPSLEVPVADMAMDTPIDPWKYTRPYNREHNSDSMEVQLPTPVDHPALPTAEDLQASIQDEVLSFEEMYNIMTKDGGPPLPEVESTTSPGDENEPIVVD